MQWLTSDTGRMMIVGIDVTHLSSGSLKGTQSIAAVVASCNHEYAQFPSGLAIQKSKQEFVYMHSFLFGLQKYTLCGIR